MGKEGEQLGVVMTVNFDSILDRAFIEIYGGLDYGIDITPLGINKANSPALLKMHGSFNWRFVNGLNLWKLRGPLGWGTFNGAIVASLDFEKNASRSDSAWLRPSVYKKPGSQLRNLWRIAERTLKEVDTLRVVGCSLRNEDWALISLIFKAQIAHQTGFGIELVVPKQDADERSSIRSRLQFLSKVKPIQDVFKEESDPGNVFKSYVINKYNEVAGKNPEIKGDNAFEGLV